MILSCKNTFTHVDIYKKRKNLYGRVSNITARRRRRVRNIEADQGRRRGAQSGGLQDAAQRPALVPHSEAVHSGHLFITDVVSSVACFFLVTFLVSYPKHKKLERGRDLNTINFLVKSNWIRTLCWSGRLVILALFLIKNPTH